MGNFFGVRRRAPVVTAQDRAVLQLKQQRDKIRIYQRKTGDELEKNQDLALKLFQKGMKERALIVLRRKKYMEEILNRTEKQLETLEQLVNDIEYTQIEVSVVEGLKVGTEALKQLNSLMNIDDIQQMMQDSDEAAEKQKEISAILQRTTERYDEDELLKELDSYLPKPQEVHMEIKEKDKIDEDLKQEAHPEEEADEREEVSTLIDNLPEAPVQLPQEPTKQKQETRQLEPAQ